MSKPTIYITGAGPGDWKLISIRGLELIKKADCIIYDYLVNPYLLRFAPKKCKLIYVGKEADKHTLSQDKINQLLLKEAKTHKTIVRLKGGDPFIFGRGAEEACFLKSKKINFEIVPGITSAAAVPAYAGIPLTERSKNSSVGFVTGHEDPTKEKTSINWESITKLGTLVFLMGVKNLPEIVKKLIVYGKPENTPIALIRQGTTPDQKTLTGNLSNIVDLARKSMLTPPAIIIVGEVVNLRNELNWFEKKPLFGKRIIVTRTREQASSLSNQLNDLGAFVHEIPTIKIVSLKADKKIKVIPNKYDWIFFSSQNGVKEFSSILNRIGKDSRIFSNAKICTIGPETAKSLKCIGLRPDYVPSEYVAEKIVKHFKANKFKGKKALILRAKLARDTLPCGLEKAGLIVDKINLYDTHIPKESGPMLKEALEEKIDFITFTSSSTVKNFIKLSGKNYKALLKGIKIASIGPITSKTLREFGLKVDKQARKYTIEGLVNIIVN